MASTAARTRARTAAESLRQSKEVTPGGQISSQCHAKDDFVRNVEHSVTLKALHFQG